MWKLSYLLKLILLLFFHLFKTVYANQIRLCHIIWHNLCSGYANFEFVQA